MAEVAEQEVQGLVGYSSKYTRNHPYLSTVRVNELLTGEGSEKETRHIESTLDEGMTYTPGDSVGILPENRAEAVAGVLAALKFRGDERVLDHYKVEISLDEALRTRLGIGKLARGSVKLYAKLAPGLEGLKAMIGPENKALAEEYCWGREFVDLVTDFPWVVKEPQQLFN
ncbi:MAG: oxidoreductase, partial [Edaphobacter sp.]